MKTKTLLITLLLVVSSCSKQPKPETFSYELVKSIRNYKSLCQDFKTSPSSELCYRISAELEKQSELCVKDRKYLISHDCFEAAKQWKVNGDLWVEIEFNREAIKKVKKEQEVSL